MKYTKIILYILIFALFISNRTFAQVRQDTSKEQIIKFPDIPGFRTLICDFHLHTVFSDGSVWPDIRVKEALREGLDAIAITDHLEYQPHSGDIPHTDRNRSYEIALEAAEGHDIIIINGAEITREMPPGHANAIFLQDANKLIQDDSYAVFQEAKKQGAFIFWNHPHWIAQRPTGVAELTDMHHKLIEEGLMDGIEIVNEDSYSDEAFQIAIDQNLAIMGSSDIHGLVDWEFHTHEGRHRPVTLVFANEKSTDALKEGLEKRRTVVWFNNTLLGDSGYLVPLIEGSLRVIKTETLYSYTGESSVQSVFIENQSNADFILQNKSDYTLYSHAGVFTLRAYSITNIQVKTLESVQAFDLQFEVLNAYMKPGYHPEVVFRVEADD